MKRCILLWHNTCRHTERMLVKAHLLCPSGIVIGRGKPIWKALCVMPDYDGWIRNRIQEQL